MGIRAITNHTNLMVATQRIERITEHHSELSRGADYLILGSNI